MPAAGSTQWWRWGAGGQQFPSERTHRVLNYLQATLDLKGGFPKTADAKFGPLPPSRIGASKLSGACSTSTEDERRRSHSFGKSYLDVLAARRGRPGPFTDAVLFPTSTEEVFQALKVAQKEDIAIVPWGGGTSVVGGVTPLTGDHQAVVTLSLEKMVAPLSLDMEDHLARFECGILGPELERYLNSHGATLGHFPQSFEFSTLGGWIATRSSGQSSSLYGEIASRVRGLKVVTAQGVIAWERPVEESTGPVPDSLFIGSEGTLGVLTEATISTSPRPTHSQYHVVLLKDWKSAVEFLRETALQPIRPAVIRVSNPAETTLSLVGRDPPTGLRRALEKTYLGYHQLKEGSACLGVIGFEGNRASVEAGWKRTSETLSRHGGGDAGKRAGESWKRERFLTPYLRDELMDHGIFVETFETGVRWSHIARFYDTLQQRLEKAAAGLGIRLFIGVHLSHAMPEGSCVYITVISVQAADVFDQPFNSLKEAVMRSIVDSGGSISHHHGVGEMHRPWIAERTPELSRELLWAAKERIDPKGLLNPGKTLPARPRA